MKKHQNVFNDFDINFPDTIDVHEHKAPTDDSVRLLNEMQEAARKNIIAKIEVKDNSLNGVALAFCDGMPVFGTTNMIIRLKFSINGREYDIEETLNQFDIMEDAEMAVFLGETFKAKVAEALFNHLRIKIIGKLSGKPIDRAEDYFLPPKK